MKRILLATTALTALLTTGALAQSDTSTQTGGMTEIETGAPLFSDGEDAMQPDGDGIYFAASEDQYLTTILLGQTIYSGAGDASEEIGDVNDIILAPNGTAEAVVIGVGGFLGIGEKEVAIAFDNINLLERDGSTWLTLNAGREDLEAAPAFDRSIFEGDFAPRTSANNMMSDDSDPMSDSMGVDVLGDSSSQDMSVGTADTAGPDGNAESADGMKQIEIDAVSANELIGARAYAQNDEDIGEIGDVILNDEGGIEAYVVDVGGFLGMGEKPVAVAAADLEILQDQNGWISVHTEFSKQQLESQPEYDPEAYDRDPDTVVLR